MSVPVRVAILCASFWVSGFAFGHFLVPAPTPQPTPRETPWLWPLPSGDGQFCIVLGNQLGTCFSVTEGPK